MSLTEWVEAFLVSPDDTVSLVIGLTVVTAVAYAAHYLGTVLAETIIAAIERDR